MHACVGAACLVVIASSLHGVISRHAMSCVQGLKSELDAAQRERDELASKLGALRSEVKATIDQVTSDRDKRLISATSAAESQLADVRVAAERRVSELQGEYERRLAGARRGGAGRRREGKGGRGQPQPTRWAGQALGAVRVHAGQRLRRLPARPAAAAGQVWQPWALCARPGARASGLIARRHS